MRRFRSGKYPKGSGSKKVPRKIKRRRTKKELTLTKDPSIPAVENLLDFGEDLFEAVDVKEEIHRGGDEGEDLFDGVEEDEALHQLCPEEMDDLQPHQAIGHDTGIVISSSTPNLRHSSSVEAELKKTDTLATAPETAIKVDSEQRDDAEARFGRYLAEKMRLVPREKRFDAEFAVLGAIREFIPR